VTESAGLQPLLDRIVAEADPRLRSNLQVVARHVVAEIAGDIDVLMATLVDEPVYGIWGSSGSVGPVGARQVREHYEQLVASGKNRLEYHLSRVVVDADAVVTDGEFRFAYRGDDVETATAGVDVDAWYLVAYQCLVVWPIAADGRIAGEEIYTGERPRIVRALGPGELPHLGPVSRRARSAEHGQAT
jgi:hypothetical protein